MKRLGMAQFVDSARVTFIVQARLLGDDAACARDAPYEL